MSGSFVVRLRGSSYKNADGTERQQLVAKCRRDARLPLRAEPDNPHDRHAVAVLDSEGNQLGYLPSDARDSSSLLRGEPISAKVKKVIGGPSWWHKLFGIKRHFGLLITITKGPVDWGAHNEHRESAQKVDELVVSALAYEKGAASVASAIEKYQAAMAAIVQLNQDDSVAAAHRYKQAPINRLTMLLVKEKKRHAALEAYDHWAAVLDPVGLTKADKEAVAKRIAKLRECRET